VHFKAVLKYMPEQCYCCVLQMLAKTGLFLAVNWQFCRLCHAPALTLTMSLQPWLCKAGITACSHEDQDATWYSACLQLCETCMVCQNFCPKLYMYTSSLILAPNEVSCLPSRAAGLASWSCSSNSDKWQPALSRLLPKKQLQP
jgi:hypothetical protein